MGIAAGVGESKLKNESFKAGKEAAEEALSQMGPGSPDLVLVFSTEGFDQHELLRGIRSVTGKIPLIGCCGAGVITEQGLSTDSIAVMVLKSDTLSISRGIGRNISSDAMRAGEESAEGLLDKLKGSKRSYYVVMMLPDGLTGNVSDVVEGAYRVLGAGCRFVGGGAGDNLKFIKTYQFLDGQVYQDAVVSALFVSNEPMGVGVRHGWTPVGKPMIVTKARGNVVMELDGKPAFEAYCEHFGIEERLSIENFSRFAMEHPLGMPDGRGEYIIRDPLQALEDGSIVCVAEVPENSVVRIMRGDKESVISAARRAAEDAMNMMARREAGAAIVFDCVSRLQLLGDKAKDELQAIRDVVGKDVPLIGFFTFGEVATGRTGPPAFCNKTVVVFTLPR